MIRPEDESALPSHMIHWIFNVQITGTENAAFLMSSWPTVNPRIYSARCEGPVRNYEMYQIELYSATGRQERIDTDAGEGIGPEEAVMYTGRFGLLRVGLGGEAYLIDPKVRHLRDRSIRS